MVVVQIYNQFRDPEVSGPSRSGSVIIYTNPDTALDHSTNEQKTKKKLDFYSIETSLSLVIFED
jgi:hypothetical protein